MSGLQRTVQKLSEDLGAKQVEMDAMSKHDTDSVEHEGQTAWDLKQAEQRVEQLDKQ